VPKSNKAIFSLNNKMISNKNCLLDCALTVGKWDKKVPHAAVEQNYVLKIQNISLMDNHALIWEQYVPSRNIEFINSKFQAPNHK
jgi:hypothetical protein